MTDREIKDGLTLAQGFSMIAWCTENNGLVAVDRTGRHYLGQEVDARIAALAK